VDAAVKHRTGRGSGYQICPCAHSEPVYLGTHHRDPGRGAAPVIFPADKKLEYTVTGTYKGSELKGIEYEQLIDWVKPDDGAFRVITGDFVTTVDGTGIVHIAPTFGADDYRAGREHGIPPLMVMMSDGFMGPLVDRRGRMVPMEDLDQAFVATRVNTATYGPSRDATSRTNMTTRFRRGPRPSMLTSQ
jgi:hypothetical protein